jgi:hypothetical protein
MRFRPAVLATPSISSAYRQGLGALRGTDRARIECRNTRDLRGSIDLDSALKSSDPQQPRWDYGIGLRKDSRSDRIVWLEVHPASPGDIEEIRRKVSWLRTWMAGAPRLRALPSQLVWMASGKVTLVKTSPRFRRLAEDGVRFAGRMLRLS